MQPSPAGVLTVDPMSRVHVSVGDSLPLAAIFWVTGDASTWAVVSTV